MSSRFCKACVAIVSLVVLCASPAISTAADKKSYTIAVIPNLPAVVLHNNWTPLVEHLSKELGVKFQLKLYDKINIFLEETQGGVPDFTYSAPNMFYLAYTKQKYIPLVRSSKPMRSEGEAIGQTLDRVFRLADNGDRRESSKELNTVLTERRTVGLAGQHPIVSRDGTSRTVTVNGAPIITAAMNWRGWCSSSATFRRRRRWRRRSAGSRSRRYRSARGGDRAGRRKKDQPISGGATCRGR